MYVIYKALGRYIYFKPQEHASKINRTFLTISLLIVLVHTLSRFTNHLPFFEEYRWLFILCGLVIFIAPLRITVDRIIWRYDKWGHKNYRNWHHDYFQIPPDYYKTNISKSENHGNSISQWEEEGVESTRKNISSDALLDILALIIFLTISFMWTYKSALTYGYQSYIFSAGACLAVAGLFIDNSLFSWILFFERKINVLLNKR